jgi:hypothetical protein
VWNPLRACEVAGAEPSSGAIRGSRLCVLEEEVIAMTYRDVTIDPTSSYGDSRQKLGASPKVVRNVPADVSDEDVRANIAAYANELHHNEPKVTAPPGISWSDLLAATGSRNP